MTNSMNEKRVESWWDEYVTVNVGLTGNFVNLYKKHKPKGMPDQSYINAIVSWWLMGKESH